MRSGLTALRQALPETVACYCSAVMHLTHEYGRVIAIYRSCQTKISGVVKTFGGDGCVPPHTLKALPMLLAIASSLASYCDLDTVKGGRPGECTSLTSAQVSVLTIPLRSDVAEALGTITEVSDWLGIACERVVANVLRCDRGSCPITPMICL